VTRAAPALPPARLSWTTWGLGALFYMTGFYHRVAPAVMTDQLMADFQIGAAALGHFSAFYFYSYVAMQVPTGILADSWGPRRLLTAGALVSSAGAILFALATSIALANLGRLLVGGAVAVAWVALLKLAANWFPARRFAFMGGLALTCGVAGAITAGLPLRLMVAAFGWRAVMGATGLISLVLAVTLAKVVRDDPAQRGFAGYRDRPIDSPAGRGRLGGLQQVLGYRNTWLLALAPAGIVGPVLAFSGLWGVPFLIRVHGLTPAQSAALASLLLAAWALGGPVMGMVSDRIGRRKPLYLAGAIVAWAGWSVLAFGPRLGVASLAILLTATGLAGSVMVTGFAFGRESVPRALDGTVNGVINMGIMIGPMVLQPAVGLLLEWSWNGQMENGVPVYTAQAFQTAFALLVAAAFAAALLLVPTKETGCRQAVQ